MCGYGRRIREAERDCKAPTILNPPTTTKRRQYTEKRFSGDVGTDEYSREVPGGKKDMRMKRRSKIPSRKITIDGQTFDSKTEMEYYFELKAQKDIKNIILQPQYSLIESFYIDCDKCISGKVKSSRTGREINCGTCKGTGKRKRKGWSYTADFEVEYQDGTKEVIDVKGHANERFPLVKKMFEYTQGQQLVVVKKDKVKGWVRS